MALTATSSSGAIGKAGKTATPAIKVMAASATEEEARSTTGGSHQPRPRRARGRLPSVGRSWTRAPRRDSAAAGKALSRERSVELCMGGMVTFFWGDLLVFFGLEPA